MLAGLQARGRALPSGTKGALGVVAAMFLFSVMDGFAKELGQTLPALQVVWARYVSQTVIILVICLPWLRTVAKTAHPKIQLLRSLLLFGATSLFFTALTYLTLAEAVAMIEVSPLIITALAALVLGEKVGARRWTAVGIGLLGALVLLRPGFGVFQPAALLALGAAVFLASYQIATRFLGGADSLWTTLLYTTGAGAVLATAAMPFLWQAPTGREWLLMATIGLPGFLGHMALVWALSHAEASAVAPFNYTGLIWAMLIGLFVFGEVPDPITLIGAAIIAGAGLYVWHRERVRSPDPA